MKGAALLFLTDTFQFTPSKREYNCLEEARKLSALRKDPPVNWKRVVVLAALVLASAAGGYQLKAHAQQQYPPACNVYIPAEWGKFQGMSTGSGMVFEDKDGNLRIIGQVPCSTDRAQVGMPRVDVMIRRK